MDNNFFSIIDEKMKADTETGRTEYKIKLGCGAEFTGVAKCKWEDMPYFNSDIGFNIAYLRAREKRYKFILRTVREMKKDLIRIKKESKKETINIELNRKIKRYEDMERKYDGYLIDLQEDLRLVKNFY